MRAAAGIWLPLVPLYLLLLLPSSEGQNPKDCNVDLRDEICNCSLAADYLHCENLVCRNLGGNESNVIQYHEESCRDLGSGVPLGSRALGAGAVVGIVLGLLMLLVGVVVGTVLGIRRKRWWEASESCPGKPSESNGSPAAAWQPRYSSRSCSSEPFPAATSPTHSAAPGPSSPGTPLYQNLFLGSQPSHQSPNSTESGTLPESEDLYMNYEDSPRSEQPIYGNVDSLSCAPDFSEPPHPGEEDEDDYVVPGC
ncbi:leucine-rich repeat-containing protein 25 [Monodelphis domestica]|uniref:leucine-rich repeat-containing protein 25 n=1 Tax=Monodelphis domestica TaxID=13616 RepID=UPI0024E20B40|nr:leucine-rich repeat-containing protein 25 [Monodelphis domestica]